MNLRDEDLVDCFEKWKNRSVSPNSWIVDAADIANDNYNMIARNPIQQKESEYGDPLNIINEISTIENDIRRELNELKNFIIND